MDVLRIDIMLNCLVILAAVFFQNCFSAVNIEGTFSFGTKANINVLLAPMPNGKTPDWNNALHGTVDNKTGKYEIYIEGQTTLYAWCFSVGGEKYQVLKQDDPVELKVTDVLSRSTKTKTWNIKCTEKLIPKGTPPAKVPHKDPGIAEKAQRWEAQGQPGEVEKVITVTLANPIMPDVKTFAKAVPISKVQEQGQTQNQPKAGSKGPGQGPPAQISIPRGLPAEKQSESSPSKPSRPPPEIPTGGPGVRPPLPGTRPPVPGGAVESDKTDSKLKAEALKAPGKLDQNRLRNPYADEFRA
ncbi:hypothetical protein DdX_20054 [Ditylenchus destructor]|uniref:Uncharacterized protein n=1 Tax=Ditylenchus destructor TaxID=166010 RepID=A0AAD4MJD6_9BILA|nr:hypothetical protein DdX_20054 [Ditylenchus destructor]